MTVNTSHFYSKTCTASAECCHKSRGTLGCERRRQGSRPRCLGQMTLDVLLGWAARAALQLTWVVIQWFCCVSVPRGGISWIQVDRVGHSPVREDEWRWYRLRGAPRKVPMKQWSSILLHGTKTGGHWLKMQGKEGSVLCKSQLNCRAGGMFS